MYVHLSAQVSKIKKLLCNIIYRQDAQWSIYLQRLKGDKPAALSSNTEKKMIMVCHWSGYGADKIYHL